MNRTIDIIYDQSLKEVNGINFVNDSFVQGNKYLKEKDFVLSKIVSPFEVFQCDKKNRLDTIGSNINTTKYKLTRKVRVFLKKLFSSENTVGALLKFYLNFQRNAKKTISNYKFLENKSDYIIFQSIFCAYYYYKSTKPEERKKCILILHCSQDHMEQFWPQFPALQRLNKFVTWSKKVRTFVFENIDHIVYLSKRAVEYSKADKSKISYIFNGEEDLSGVSIEDVHTPINLVCVGSMSWRKGQDIILEALTKLPQNILNRYKLHLIGDGPQMSELKNFVAENNLEKYVVFYGTRNDVPDLLKRMDVFIMPSKSEGLPMSIIEALRQGLYIMATDTGAIPEMIAPGCGVLIERKPEEIANSLITMFDKNLISIEIKRRSRIHYLKHFTLKNMMSEYCKMLEEL